MSTGVLIIRADATVTMGTGHVMRCLALAQAWQDAGGTCVFAMAESTQAVEERVQAEGFSVARSEGAPGSAQDAAGLAQLAGVRGAHWVVVDGYQFGGEYQRKLKEAGLKILFVDDHGHAEHYSADLVLNQNYHATGGLYSNRETYTRLLLGPKYAMLRREFSKWREWKREIPAVARKVLVTMGGSDPDNITLRVMKALATVEIDGLRAVVVSGGSNPHIGSLEKAAAQFVGKIDLVTNISNMPERMAWADIGITTAGGTLWELLCMGCPVLTYARNSVHERIIAQLQGEGIVRGLGDPRNYDEASLVSTITELATSPECRAGMSSLGIELGDGLGPQRLCHLLAGENVPPVEDRRAEMPSARWELGSEFSWCELPETHLLSWPTNARWYTLGRHAIAALLQFHSQAKPRLWLPSYFCGGVAEFCQQYCEVNEYRDDPRWPEPDWSSLRPTRDDIVVAVNYFGVRSAASWQEWRAHNECFLLEDHSQDLFSPWCSNSNADYAFASLRKTLPLSDGGLLWSPRGLRLPEQLAQDDGDWTGSALKMAAMFHKANYLRGLGPLDLKPHFRTLQSSGEQRLRAARISSISPYSYAYIAQGVPEIWRKQRLNNVRHLRQRLADITFATPLFNSWTEGAVPFAFPLIFGSCRERDECQTHMQQHNMYCPVHWECQTSDAQALDLASRILSLPADQRYSPEEMDRLADVLLGFQGDQANQKPERHGSPVQTETGPFCIDNPAPAVEMRPVLWSDRENFLAMAQQFFLDLNPNFVPHPDWKQYYFDNVLQNPCWFLRWIFVDGHCAGYILFGLENHRFLPRKTGTVYALYVQPEFRRKGIARVGAEQAIQELQAQSPSKIELEIMEENQSAIAFWESIGFKKISGRFVLRNVAQ